LPNKYYPTTSVYITPVGINIKINSSLYQYFVTIQKKLFINPYLW